MSVTEPSDAEIIAKVRALRAAGDLLGAEDLAHAQLCSRCRNDSDRRLAFLEALADVFTSAREHWSRPYTFPSPTMIARAEAASRKSPLADELNRAYLLWPIEHGDRPRRLFVAAATIYADYGDASKERIAALAGVWTSALLVSDRDDTKAAGDAIATLLPEGDRLGDIDAAYRTAREIADVRPEIALPFLEAHLALLEHIATCREDDRRTETRECAELIERVRAK